VSNLDPLILVVEDEIPMRRFLRASLTAHGYRVIEAGSVAEGTLCATSHSPRAILLDLGLPDGDGIDFTRRLREWCTTPIIVLSARGCEGDKVDALDAGADDYITKPFGVNELMARLRVALRHAESSGAPAPEVFDIGGLHLDLARREVRVDGREVHLTPIEYKLLSLLTRNVGRVLTHRQILKEVWGPAYLSQSHYVRVHIAELRKKIEADPARPGRLITEPGVGYRLRD